MQHAVYFVYLKFWELLEVYSMNLMFDGLHVYFVYCKS